MSCPTNGEPDDLLRRLAEEIRVWRREAAPGPETVDDLALAGYVAGTLDEGWRKWVEEQIAASPDLAEIVRVVRESLQEGDWRAEGAEAAAKVHLPLVLGSRPPAAVRMEPAVERRPRPRPRRSVPRWAAAAALVLLFLLGLLAVAVTFGPSIRDAFRVRVDRMGGETDSKLDAGITNRAAGETEKALSDLKK